MKHEFFFKQAIELANQAAEKDEVPIGAILVKDDKIISSSHNLTEQNHSFIAHAEILCIQQANQVLGSKYLNGCHLYVPLEPCGMCHYAAKLSRIESIFYLIDSSSFGIMGKAYKDLHIQKLETDFSPQYLALLQSFFKQKR